MIGLILNFYWELLKSNVTMQHISTVKSADKNIQTFTFV